MHTIRLNNGLEMPIQGFGTFQIQGETCVKAVRDALQAGYRMIDTAQAYGNEEAVGKGIQESGIDREEIFLITKVNFPSYEQTEQVLERSLEKLKTDYLDLVLLHWPFGNYYKAWRILEKYYTQGKIRAIGVSNFDMNRLIDLIHFYTVVPAVNQIETNLYCQRQEEREWMKKYNVQAMAYAPLGQGSRLEMFKEACVLELGEKYGKTAAQIVLRFLVQEGISVIPKSVHPKRILENHAIFDFELSSQEIQRLKRLDQNLPCIGRAEEPAFVEMAMTW